MEDGVRRAEAAWTKFAQLCRFYDFFWLSMARCVVWRSNALIARPEFFDRRVMSLEARFIARSTATP